MCDRGVSQYKDVTSHTSEKSELNIARIFPFKTNMYELPLSRSGALESIFGVFMSPCPLIIR